MTGYVYIIAFFCLLASFCDFGQCVLTYMKSVKDDMVSDLAVDGDPATCAMSGLHTSSWWKIDLGEEKAVTSVTIHGFNSAMANIDIKVGNLHANTTDYAGHELNAKCGGNLGDLDMTASGMYTVICPQPLAGRYVSIDAERDGDYVRMSLCEVDINTL